MVYQHGSPFYDEDKEECMKMHRKAFRAFPVSRVYQAHIPTCSSGYWLFGFASKKYHPLNNLRVKEWKKLHIKTRYYTTNLHQGAFMLPKEKKMSKVMIIGCGGVASVAIAKCCQNSDVFTEIMIASRTKSKCDAMKEKLQPTTKTVITTAQVDADNTEELIALINEYKPDAVLNVALPYQDLTIMDACLATGVDYIDTANYEAENTDDPEWRKIYEERCKKEGFTAYFDYSWQWAYMDRFKEAGITGLLGTGFDPGPTNPVTPLVLRTTYHVSSFMIIWIRT